MLIIHFYVIILHIQKFAKILHPLSTIQNQNTK